MNEIHENGFTETNSVNLSLSQIVQRINPTFSGDFNYWFYNGSLTTPNCNEAVNWILAEKPLQITKEQVISNTF